MALIVEDGSVVADANSFCSLQEADDYHDQHLYGDAWVNSDTTNKERALQMATRLLDSEIKWKGQKTDVDSALSWPRKELVTTDGQEIGENSIPIRLKEATAELARLLIIEDRTAESDAAGIKELVVGPIELKFTDAASAGKGKPIIPRSALVLISDFTRVGGPTMAIVRRG